MRSTKYVKQTFLFEQIYIKKCWICNHLSVYKL